MLFLLFQLGSDCYALPSSRVVEVLMLPELKSWPEAPKRVAGIFNYRGSPVPAVDLCLLAAGFPARERLGTRLIVVRYPDAQGTERLLGLIAEKVTDTLRKDPREFRDSGLSNRAAPCLGPIYMDGQRPVQWLDERRLVAEPFSNFDRLLPVEYRGEGRPTLERQTKPKNPDRISTVLFRIESEWLALPTRAFQEVAEQRRIHSLPHRRGGLVLGLANIRGELLPALSLGRLLGLFSAGSAAAPRPPCPRLLVAGWEPDRFVFPVDEVHGLHRLQPDDIKEPPATLAKSSPGYTQGVFLWNGGSAGLLDFDRICSTFNRNLS